MKTLALTPETLGAWGRTLIRAGFGFGLLILAFLTWAAPEILPFFPALLLAGIGAWYLFRHPLLNLCVVLAGAVVLSRFKEGFQPEEILYGLYYLSFLTYWYFTRLFLYQNRLIRDPSDRGVAFFLVWMTLAFGLTLVFGGKLRDGLSEWIALSMLAFYFPVKELCLRYRHGPTLVLGLILWLGFFITAGKYLNYRETLLNATQAWEVVRGRAPSYEMFVMIPSLILLVLLITVKRWSHRLVLLVGFFFFFIGLLMTQSRGYWADFAFGSLILLLLIPLSQKKRLLLFGLYAGTGTFVVALLLFGDLVPLILAGLLDRLLSIGSAASKDVSMLNRFLEYKAVWERIRINPILGYGPGVSYRYFDIVYGLSITKSFTHNGFLALWYKYGLLGLLAMIFVWLRNIWGAIRVYRTPTAPPRWRLQGLIAGVCLMALLPASNTSPPFFLALNVLMLTLLMGWASGLYQRLRLERPLP